MVEKYFIGQFEVSADDLVDKSIASRFLGVSVRTLEDWTTDGKIPMYKLSPRAVRYRVKEIVEWVNRHAVEPKSER